MFLRALLALGVLVSSAGTAQTSGPSIPVVAVPLAPPPVVRREPQLPVPDKLTRFLPRPTRDETCLPRRVPISSEVHAGGGSDRVWAGDPPGRLFGDADDDFVSGGPANDEIHGGTGADILIGGAGSDLFVLDTVEDSPTDENGDWSPLSGDTVVDFTTPDFDKFDLRKLELVGDGAPRHFFWSGRRPAAYGVWTQPRAGDTIFLVDVDGNSVADIGVRLIGTITLEPSDFCGVLGAKR